jgi:flavin reductase (DIM6/NTAB) family NADH-FMN oxidoreductase RutF
MYPFEKFTEDAKRTLTLAQDEAERARHSYIGTEHLLLGLLRGESGPARRVLTELGISIEPVREVIQSVLGSNELIRTQSIIPTSRVKRVIEIAFGEARRMGHDSVNSGHLLMALVLEREGIAAHVLSDLGASASRVVTAVEVELGTTRTAQTKDRRIRASDPGIDPQRFREVMASFPSGVVALTAFGNDSRPRGLTVSAFCAVSLEPPLALACVDKTSNTLPAVHHSGGFTANILAAGREQLALRMATKLTDKFDGIVWRRPAGNVGGPILEEDAAAYAVCALRDTIDAGDHWILIGTVTEGAQHEGVAPMIYSRRTYLGL